MGRQRSKWRASLCPRGLAAAAGLGFVSAYRRHRTSESGGEFGGNGESLPLALPACGETPAAATPNPPAELESKSAFLNRWVATQKHVAELFRLGRQPSHRLQSIHPFSIPLIPELRVTGGNYLKFKKEFFHFMSMLNRTSPRQAGQCSRQHNAQRLREPWTTAGFRWTLSSRDPY